MRAELPAEYHGLIGQDFDGEARLAETQRMAAEAGVEMEWHVAHCGAAEAILAVAEEVDADLVVVGARGMGPVGRFLRGSVSTKVAHHAPCDVLVVEHGTD